MFFWYMCLCSYVLVLLRSYVIMFLCSYALMFLCSYVLICSYVLMFLPSFLSSYVFMLVYVLWKLRHIRPRRKRHKTHKTHIRNTRHIRNIRRIRFIRFINMRRHTAACIFFGTPLAQHRTLFIASYKWGRRRRNKTTRADTPQPRALPPTKPRELFTQHRAPYTAACTFLFIEYPSSKATSWYRS